MFVGARRLEPVNDARARPLIGGRKVESPIVFASAADTRHVLIEYCVRDAPPLEVKESVTLHCELETPLGTHGLARGCLTRKRRRGIRLNVVRRPCDLGITHRHS